MLKLDTVRKKKTLWTVRGEGEGGGVDFTRYHLTRFSSVHGGIHALQKAHMRSTLSIRGFPNIDNGQLSFFQGRSSIERFLCLRLSPTCDWWYRALGLIFAPAAIKCLNLLNISDIFWDAYYFCWLLSDPAGKFPSSIPISLASSMSRTTLVSRATRQGRLTKETSPTWV